MAQPRTSAASDTPAGKPSKEEVWQARLQYGIVTRSGAVNDSGPGLTYTGLTPNDFAVRGWLWLLADLAGVGLSVEREAFALYDNGVRITGGGLIRAHVGPTFRYRLGPVRLEALAGYAFHQLPDFGNTATTPVFGAGSRHGLMLAARGLFDIGPVTVEGRFEYPLPLVNRDSFGQPSKMGGLTAGGGVRVALARTGNVIWGAMADASYTTDSAPANAVYQRLIRAGLALDLQWKVEPLIIRTGGITIYVKTEDGRPLGRAMVTLDTPSGLLSPSLDDEGHAMVADVLAGHLSAQARLEGYDPIDQEGDLSAGGELTLTFALHKTPPTVGSLLVSVADKVTKRPLSKVKIRLGEETFTTDDQGKAVLKDLKPGLFTLAFTADGYQPTNEAASVVAGVDSPLEVSMLSAKKRELATITGLVRSARGGSPIQANLEIPEANLRAKANDKGAFNFRVIGGTYTVTISGRGFMTQIKQIVVKDAEQAILNVDLQPK